MLYLSLFCLNLLYKSLDVYNSGGGVVPNSDVYKYSDPPMDELERGEPGGGGAGELCRSCRLLARLLTAPRPWLL